VFLYSGCLLYLFEFLVQGRRGWPDSQSLLIRFAHPTGRLAGAQQKTLCLQQQKVTKKCRNLTTKLEHDGCISQSFLSSSFRGFIAKRYRGYFFERHAELNSKKRPLGTIFTCSKIKRSLLNLFVVASLCFERSAESE
jgi:hypothetical protein